MIFLMDAVTPVRYVKSAVWRDGLPGRIYWRTPEEEKPLLWPDG